MILAIEIGGTKLQWAITDPLQPQQFVDAGRDAIDRQAGAEGIRAQILTQLSSIGQRFPLTRIGVGFGGPVIAAEGWVITSHQVNGWDDFPLGAWLQQKTHLPTVVDNDCNLAALAEALLGAGHGKSRVLYVTIGTGVGGGFVVDGHIDGQSRPAVAEIGHLRPGLTARDSGETVESWSSGLGMETRLRAALDDPAAWGCDASDAQELLDQEQVHGRALTAAELVAQALSGQRLASAVLVQGTKVLGWALAQATTLMAPERIVIGGGVSLAGEPLRQLLEESWKTYVFPPMREQCDLVIGQLGEQVVLHGATQLAMASV